MRATVDVTGDEAVERLISRTGRHAADARPALRSVADYLRSVERQQFAMQGGARSGGWGALAKSTVARKGSARILVDTSALMRSLTTRGGAGAKERITRDTLTFGTSVYYARFVAKRRPLVDPNRQDAKRVGSIIRDHVLSR